MRACPLSNASCSTYALPVDARGITPRIESIYRGKFIYPMFNNSTLDQVPGYGLVHLHLDCKPMHYWTLVLTLSNLVDKNGNHSRFTDPYGTGPTSNEYTAPRQIIAKVGYDF